MGKYNRSFSEVQNNPQGQLLEIQPQRLDVFHDYSVQSKNGLYDVIFFL